MQFSVVVHCADENGAAEKIQHMLETLRITPDLLHTFGPGKPLLIKRRFTEPQASRLRDKLLGLGLESSILPLSRLQSPATPADLTTRETVNANGPAAQALHRTDQQIQSLFDLPSKGLPESKPQKAAGLRSWLLCTRILIRPLLEILLSLCIGGLLIMGLGWLTTLAAGYLLLLGIVLLPLFLVLALNLLALVAFFMWPRDRRPVVRLSLKAGNDPRLMLFVSTVCRLLKTAPPTTLWLTMDSRIRADFKPDHSSQHSMTLELGLPLLQTLTLAELAALVASECGRHNETATHAPFQLVGRVRESLRGYLERELELTGLKQTAARLESQSMAETLHRAASALQAGEKWRIRWAQAHLKRLDRLLANASASRRARQLFWGGPTSTLDSRIRKTTIAFKKRIKQLECPDGSLLVDQVGAFLTADCPPPARPPANGLVQSQTQVRALIKNLDQYDKALSRLFYQSRGLDLKNYSLLSHDEILLQRRRDAQSRQIADDYFSGWLKSRQFWQIAAAGSNRRETLLRLNRCIAQLRHLAPERNGLIAKQQRLQHQLAELRAAKKVIANGGAFKFIHCLTAPSDLATGIKSTEAKLRECDEELFHQNSIMGERLTLGLTLAQQHGLNTENIINALRCLAKTRLRHEQLQLELGELEQLQANNSGMLTNSFARHQRELQGSIEQSCQIILRQFQHCPYEFCEPNMANLGRLMELRIQQHRPRLAAEKAQLLLAVMDEAQEKISCRAAGIATQIERHYKVDKIKRLHGLAAKPIDDFPRDNSA